MDRATTAYWAVLLAVIGLTSAAVMPATAQTVRSAVGTPQRPYIPPTRQPHSSTAKDATPLHCEQYRTHPNPGMVRYCEGLENTLLQNEAQRQGKPAPSRSVIQLPGLGTPEAKALGYACVNGRALKRLSNGWAQVSAADGVWQRCQGG
ncbi:hypothetical protein SAMN05428989_3332 [Pseudoxanthomonas sp. GM95]|uniref:hypothetical protein n=1 Tax=Pseudoxanthomonas sp. GM95 TaxID=1881043 RepID=UPI0008C78A0C|nr:hypothetical protein [Pseudoxanthomonas sp. GM95]SEM19553.1 hypothetical protein SAMN05428989_3332 [Pseudoxanthomonas sp. GM95]